MRIAFTTNFCSHYRIKPFETLGRCHEVDYYFYSGGSEWYWQAQHGVRIGDFNYSYLPGCSLAGTRITPALPVKLWRGDYDVFIKCINGRFALPAAYLVARLRRKPFILWTEVWSRTETLFHKLFFPFTRYIYLHADAIVAGGEHTKRYLVSEGVQPERIFVAPDALDNQVYSRKVEEKEKASLRQKLNIQPGQQVVLYLGRLEESKGLPYLLEAFSLLSDDKALLVIVGTGKEKLSLEHFAHDKNLTERVRFIGYVTPEETLPFYAISSVFVLPSITTPEAKEPWGFVVNEALNQGLPVIASDAVGAAAGGLVQDGVNGFIVPERDRAALAEALQKILDSDDLRQRLGDNARKVIKRWDHNAMIQGFLDAVIYVTGKK